MGEQNDTGIGQEGSDLLTSGMGAEDNQTQDVDTGSTDSQAGDTGDQTQQEQGAGSDLPAWMSQLSDDLKGSESLTKFKKVSELGKSYVELEGKLGNSITIPGDDATDEDKAAFLDKLGRPESAEKYEIQYRDELPESMKKDLANSEPKLRETMYKHGLSQEQAKGMLDWIQDELKIGADASQRFHKEQQEQAIATMKEEWGGNYDDNLNVMTFGLQRLAGNDKGFIKRLRETGLVNDPALARVFLNVGKLVSEDTLIDGGDGEGDDPDDDTLKF